MGCHHLERRLISPFESSILPKQKCTPPGGVHFCLGEVVISSGCCLPERPAEARNLLVAFGMNWVDHHRRRMNSPPDTQSALKRTGHGSGNALQRVFHNRRAIHCSSDGVDEATSTHSEHTQIFLWRTKPLHVSAKRFRLLPKDFFLRRAQEGPLVCSRLLPFRVDPLETTTSTQKIQPCTNNVNRVTIKGSYHRS